MKELLVNYTKYNLWANAKITESLISLDPQLLDKKLVSSFNTIRKTAYHIWDAEIIWYNRLKGVSVTDLPSKTFSGSNNDFFKKFVEHSSRFPIYVEEKSEEELSSTLKYKTLDGKEYGNKMGYIIQHVVNHSTFHRGQIVTMLRNVGYTELSSTDFSTFIRENKT